MVMKKKSKTTAMKQEVELSCSIKKNVRKRARTVVVHFTDDSVLEDVLNTDPAYATVEQVTLQRLVDITVLTFHISEEDEVDDDDDNDDDDVNEDFDGELDDELSEALDDDNEDGEL